MSNSLADVGTEYCARSSTVQHNTPTTPTVTYRTVPVRRIATAQGAKTCIIQSTDHSLPSFPVLVPLLPSFHPFYPPIAGYAQRKKIYTYILPLSTVAKVKITAFPDLHYSCYYYYYHRATFLS